MTLPLTLFISIFFVSYWRIIGNIERRGEGIPWDLSSPVGSSELLRLILRGRGVALRCGVEGSSFGIFFYGGSERINVLTLKI